MRRLLDGCESGAGLLILQTEQQRIERLLRWNAASIWPAGISHAGGAAAGGPATLSFAGGPAGPGAGRLMAKGGYRVAGKACRLCRVWLMARRGAGETDAVLFYDRAEVLAALALDWMSGTLPAQWWWREFLRGRDAITTLWREWMDAPQYVPGALDLLVRRARAAQFVQRMPQQAANEILEAMLVVFSVPRPQEEDKAPQKNSADSRPEALQPVAATAKTKKARHSQWCGMLPSGPGFLKRIRLRCCRSRACC